MWDRSGAGGWERETRAGLPWKRPGLRGCHPCGARVERARRHRWGRDRQGLALSPQGLALSPQGLALSPQGSMPAAGAAVLPAHGPWWPRVTREQGLCGTRGGSSGHREPRGTGRGGGDSNGTAGTGTQGHRARAEPGRAVCPPSSRARAAAGDTGDNGDADVPERAGDIGDPEDTRDPGDIGDTGDPEAAGDTGSTGDAGDSGDPGDTHVSAGCWTRFFRPSPGSSRPFPRPGHGADVPERLRALCGTLGSRRRVSVGSAMG